MTEIQASDCVSYSYIRNPEIKMTMDSKSSIEIPIKSICAVRISISVNMSETTQNIHNLVPMGSVNFASFTCGCSQQTRETDNKFSVHKHMDQLHEMNREVRQYFCWYLQKHGSPFGISPE